MQQSFNKLLFYDKMCWECYIWNAVILESPQSEVYSGGRMGGGEFTARRWNIIVDDL